jgi:hypothetical protein
MASKTAAISVNVIADAAKFKAGLKDAEAAAGSFNNQMKNMAKGVAAAVGTAAVINFGKAAVSAAMDDAAAQVELQRQLTASTGATAAQVAAIEDYISKTQRATGVLDDQLRPAFSTLTRFTKDQTKSQDLLNIALDISTATGKPLEAVSLALGKAYGGSTTALQKLGIQTKDAAGEALSFDTIQQNLITTFGGATQAAAETTAGKMKIAQASFADMQEEIGVALIPVLTGLLDAITPIIDAFSSLSPEQQAVIVNAVMMVGAVKAATTALTALGVAAGTAQAAALPLLALMAAFAAFQAYRSGNTVDNTWLEENYADELQRTIGLEGEALKSGFLNLRMRASQLKGAGELAEGVSVTEEAFKALAQASPATARAVLEFSTAASFNDTTLEKLNGILDETITKQAGVGTAARESAAMIDEASEAVETFYTEWQLLMGLLSDRVMWDNLDTSFDNLKEKAAAAFGGSEQDVKDFNVAALQAAEYIAKVSAALELPEEVQTRIAILYDQGKFDQIYGLLRALDPASVREAFAAINGPFLPGMASGGTVTSSGMALIGENGPEILNLPRGATVTPLTGTSGGGGNTINITVTSANPDDVVAAIQAWSRNNGAVPIRTTSTRTG